MSSATQAALSIAGSGEPFLKARSELGQLIFTTAESVKVHRQQCKDLGNRCCLLLLVLKDSESSLDDTKLRAAADEVELTISAVHERLKQWASLSRVRSFIQQAEIKEGIERCNRDIDACIKKFNADNFAMKVDLRKEQTAAIQECDRVDLRETLQAIIKDMDDLKSILNMKSPAAVEGIMKSIQGELHDPSLETLQEENFRQGLGFLHEKTSILPPMTDLTGQVEMVSEHPVSLGAFGGVCTGKWLGNEKVALQHLRALGDNPGVRARFEKEVNTWRNLKHKNVTPLYGIVTMGDRVYSVSPWMDNGNVTSYVSKHEEANRLQLLSDIACGMEYLHSNQVVHGDLRGANILISREGIARVSDFGLSGFLEEVGQGLSYPEGVNPRWLAPELIIQPGPPSTYSDVWSFGMLCLELMTGQQPFSELPRDINVMFALANKQTPQRPAESFIAASQGLSQDLWELMLKCWQPDPTNRPSMAELKSTLDRLRTEYGPLQSEAPRQIESYSGQFYTNTARLSAPATSSSRGWQSSTGASSTWSGDSDLPPLHGELFPPTSPNSFVSQHRKNAIKGWNPASIIHKLRPTLSRRGQQPKDLELETKRPDDGDASNWLTVAPKEPSSHAEGRDRNMLFLPQHSRTGTEAGTFDDLMERLIVDSGDPAMDLEYREIFLTTYLAFTNAEEVVEHLISQFNDVSTKYDLSAELRAGRRYNIIMVLKHWVANPRIQADMNILNRMKEFALSVTSSATMTKLANDVAATIDKRMQRDLLVVSPLDLSDVIVPRSVDVTPRDVAECLTLVEGEAYDKILPADYIAQVLALSVANHVEAASATNNKIGYWVKWSILRQDRIESRGEMFKFFVNTAEECRRLCNFASVSAIAGALLSDPITRLHLTKQELTRRATTVLDRLDKLLSPANNHRAYRETLRESSSPCVPWVAVHLRDLTAIFQQYPSIIEINGEPLINFTRCIKTAALMKGLVQYVVPKLPPNTGKLAYLLNQLRNLGVHQSSDEDLDARSKLLDAEERKTLNLRHQELCNLGFTASGSSGSLGFRKKNHDMPKEANTRHVESVDIDGQKHSSSSTHTPTLSSNQSMVTPEENPSPLSYFIDLVPLSELVDPIPEHDPNPHSVFLDLHPLEELVPPIPEVAPQQAMDIELHDG